MSPRPTAVLDPVRKVLPAPAPASIEGEGAAGSGGSSVVTGGDATEAGERQHAGALVHLRALTERAADFATASKASSTLRAYRHDWGAFCAWAAGHGLAALPARPETVAVYLTALASDEGKSVATLQRRISAISQAHKLGGFASPTAESHVRAVMSGIRRKIGAPPTQKAAAIVEQLRAMVATLGPSLAEVRDRALLLVGFAGAFRRAELVSLEVRDVQFTPHAGMVVTLRRSKTDQEGEGHKRGVPYGDHVETCPVRALQARTAAAGITEGALFRAVDQYGRVAPGALAPASVAEIVKRTAERAGLDPKLYGGHSLRAGLATSAAAAGVEERHIMDQGNWKSLIMVRRYIRTGEPLQEERRGRGRTIDDGSARASQPCERDPWFDVCGELAG